MLPRTIPIAVMLFTLTFAVSATAQPTVTPAAATVNPGAPITFTVAGGPGNRFDWVGLYQSSASDTAHITWQYLNGSMTAPASGVTGATLQFTAPLTGGTYNVRLFSNNEYIRLATSTNVTVPAPTVTLGAATVSPGGTINVTVAGGPGHRLDWVGLYQPSASDTTFTTWQYLNGTKSAPASGVTGATLQLTAPLTGGTFNVRLFSNNGYLLLATSTIVTVPAPAVSLAPATVRPGDAIGVRVAGGPGNRLDWVGLYQSSASDTAFVTWQYLNGLRTAPASGVTDATLQFAAPQMPGTYNARFFSNDDYIRLASSDSFAVTLPLTAAPYISGLTMPVAFVQDPMNPNVQYVVQQAGQIRVIQSGVLQATNFADLSAQIACCNELGLLGLAFPPDYAASRRFYVTFSNVAGNTVVARLRRSVANPLVADTSDQLHLRWGGAGGLRYLEQPGGVHKGGNLMFGPDGYLYIGLGDGGQNPDSTNPAQHPDSLLGKMLRIDVSVPDGNPDGYVVPVDNPFVSAPPALPEIWAFGLRNPWKFSFDDGPGGTNALAIGDVGANNWEEVNFEPSGHSGRNYGWVRREATHPTPGVSVPPVAGAPATLTDPVIEIEHPAGNSVTGGFVYRGAALAAALNGRYFFADFIRRRVWSVLVGVGAGGELTASNLVDHTAGLGADVAAGHPSAFGRDADGELYLVMYNTGVILKLVPGP
jgi:glucose/arabinose dehydrogenase